MIYLVCDPPTTPVASYEVEIDGVVYTVTPDPTGKYGFHMDLIALGLTDGSHTARARALNDWGESGWATLTFSKAAPAVPANLELSTS